MMKKPLLYALWGISAASFMAIAGPMLFWQWLSKQIDDAFDVW